MSDRFYTTLTVSGPNAATAEKAAIDAIKSAPENSLGYHACWIDAETTKDWPLTPKEREEVDAEAHFFDHDSGEGAIDLIGNLSRQFPTETFTFDVAGDYGAGVQGPVIINNGKVRDGRNESPSFGGYDPYCGKCNALVTSPNLRLALGDMAEHKIDSAGHVECECGTCYEFEVKNGELVFFGTVYEIRGEVRA